MFSRCTRIFAVSLGSSSTFLSRQSAQLVKSRRVSLRYHHKVAMASIMQEANRLRRVMEEGKEPAMGCWQMIPGANVSRTLARTGVDWVLVDCEHGNIDGKLGFF